MVPADADDIADEYRILKSELKAYNPELLYKESTLAITKCDMLDQELKDEIRKELDKNLSGINYLFISSVAQSGIVELKDAIWKTLNDV